MGKLLYIIAWGVQPIFMVWNYFLIEDKTNYSYKSALNFDKYANKEYAELWNKYLITKDGYKFGNEDESLSEVLGVNILKETLTNTGKKLVKLLTEKHCLDAIKLN